MIQSAEAYVSNRLLEESPDPRSASLLQLPAVATIPLSARGEVVGALAVGRSKAFTSEDVRLLTSIADMVANAVRRVTLREQTERDALQLARAYELDDFRLVGGAGLEDQETEGHTQRVTELTLRLARASGMSAESLAHIRRGALLHDIGKMGFQLHLAQTGTAGR